MFNIPETPDAQCFTKAVNRGEQTFTLVEHDSTAPGTILDWINRNFATASAEKLRTAFATALRWRDSEVTKRTPY
jgi:hypothetical protein